MIWGLVEEWNGRLEELLASSPLRKRREHKTEASFTNFYSFREKVPPLPPTLSLQARVR